VNSVTARAVAAGTIEWVWLKIDGARLKGQLPAFDRSAFLRSHHPDSADVAMDGGAAAVGAAPAVATMLVTAVAARLRGAAMGSLKRASGRRAGWCGHE
jgi:hypothetical protein